MFGSYTLGNGPDYDINVDDDEYAPLLPLRIKVLKNGKLDVRIVFGDYNRYDPEVVSLCDFSIENDDKLETGEILRYGKTEMIYYNKEEWKDLQRRGKKDEEEWRDLRR